MGAGKPAAIEPTQEIRFAVVMYGGSSLSIYMYGIAQELLRLVRATTRDVEDPLKPLHELSSSEFAYEELGRRLVRGQPVNTALKPESNEIRTRFVIDLLSGTSAGGINSVFLAKALANDVELGPLRELWLEKADFANLLNDRQGEARRDQKQKIPKSLVNSPFMYSLLKDALDRMDGDPGKPKPKPSPYADQLDLFTTFTDVQGRTISLKLTDGVAMERQHLHNFHFLYSTGEAGFEKRNDFEGTNNPFLAFAARSSSAHQAAFEPMALADIAAERGCDPDRTDWRKFYAEYLRPEPNGGTIADCAKKFQRRPLVDGGTLDNSPFTFAVDHLRFRHVTVPVDRKLIYVEPDPGHPEEEPDTNDKPDAIRNAIMALSSIPSYQFIRDDIRRIADRNTVVDRVNRVLDGIEKDYKRNPIPSLSGAEFRKADLDGMIEHMGRAWGGYHTLRVQETTADLTRIIAGAAGYGPDSIEFGAVEKVVRSWRAQNYVARRKSDQDKSENEFLYDFDLQRQIRRLKFVIRQAGLIGCFDEHATTMHGLENRERYLRHDKVFQRKAREALSVIIKQLSDELKKFYDRRRLLTSFKSPLEDTPAARASKHPLADDLTSLQAELSKPLADKPADSASVWQLLLQLPAQPASKLGDEFVAGHAGLLTTLTDAVKDKFDVIPAASKRIKGLGKGDGILEIPAGASEADASVLVKQALRHYYENFDQYDMISYPILYSTNAGDELDKVEVFRISPEDVKTPIQAMSERRKKLAGLQLGHFGALVNKNFRYNDILWGRLDCAERLITLLLSSAPPPADAAGEQALSALRDRLIREAQEAIVVEEAILFPPDLRGALDLTPKSSLPDENRHRTRAEEEIAAVQLSPDVREYVQTLLYSESPIARFARNYAILHKPDTRQLVSLAGRASRILGKMFDDIADQYHIKGNPQIAWVTRLMRLFWGFTEVSFPDSFFNIIWRHLTTLLYVFEALMIIGGWLLGRPTVSLGFILLGVTLAANAVILILKDFENSDIRDQKQFWIRAMRVVTASVASVVVLAGVLLLAAVKIDPLWDVVGYIHFKLTR